MRTLRSISVVAVALWLVALTPANVFGHGDLPPEPPSPPPAPTHQEFQWIYPARWSWLHWWEANRDPYLEILRQGRGQKPDQQAIAKFRSQAVESLLKAITSAAWQERASAAMALGQMGQTTALDSLSILAVKDSDVNVRQAALVAVGLLDVPASEQFLTGLDPQGPEDREARLAALGLLSHPEARTVTGWQRAVNGGDAAMAAISAWALSRSTDPANTQFLQGLLSRSANPWVTSEAILSLGRQANPDSAAALAQILQASQAGLAVPVMKDLHARHTGLMYLQNLSKRSGGDSEYEKAYAQYQKDFEAWKKQVPLPPGAQRGADAKAAPNVQHLVIGLELIYENRLRASAAIALGHIDSPASREALRKSLEGKDDGFNQLYKEHAIMSLGQLGDTAAMPALLEILYPTVARGVVISKDKLKSPLRGFGALALGLYCRPVKGPQPQNRPGCDAICQKLAERIADSNDEQEVRAACAVALGLTGRTENLKYFQAASKGVGTNDLLVGYVIMGRGMLGDRSILEPAKTYLAVANDRSDMSGTLGRRAAVLGLGLTGLQEAIPLLVDAWDLSYYVNRETALAMAFCQAQNATDRLVKLMSESDKPLEKAFAARCLGELFMKARPSRLGWLINDGNYMIKNGRLLPHQRWANEFMYCYLLPSFGDDWR